jgi:hypothetical protein
MYLYAPNSVKANPSILLALHGCQGSGPFLAAYAIHFMGLDGSGSTGGYQRHQSGLCLDVTGASTAKRRLG